MSEKIRSFQRYPPEDVDGLSNATQKDLRLLEEAIAKGDQVKRLQLLGKIGVKLSQEKKKVNWCFCDLGLMYRKITKLRKGDENGAGFSD
jgi:hypothetical protein